MAILQRNRFVSGPRLVFFVERISSPATIQPFAPDSTRSRDAAIVQVLAPDQTVVPVGVTVILVRMPGRIGLGRVIAASGSIGRLGCRQNRRPLIQKQRDIAFQVDGIARIRSRREVNHPATCSRRRINRLIHRRRVDGSSVTDRAKPSHRKEAAGNVGAHHCVRIGRPQWICAHQRCGNPAAGKFQQVSSRCLHGSPENE